MIDDQAPSLELARLRVLILGGYGTFGGRLAQLLARDERLWLVLAGRSAEAAARFAARLPPGADRIAVRIDRDRDDLDRVLADMRPQLVVDASGPFQTYGHEPYRVVEACIRFGADYLDLADSSSFVAGIGAFDQAARDRKVFVLSGASSFPVLTAAAARELARGLASIDSIKGGIAPSPYAGVGLNVVRAIASYAGKPVAIVRDGIVANAFPLTETMRYTIAPPGRLPLRNILFSLVDVPDLRVLPALFPGLKSVWMGAGPVPEYLHRLLIFLARLVSIGGLASLQPFAWVFHRVMNALAHGEHRGGMFVEVAGSAGEGPLARAWHLLAEADDGPLIPSMTCEAIIRHCLSGRRPAAGARAAAGELSLADYEQVFAGRKIFTGIREASRSAATPLYRRILGSAYEDLPAAVRRMHDLAGAMTARGTADVDRGPGPIPWLACRLAGFPKTGRDIPVEVTFRRQDGKEIWTRSFAGQTFSSIQGEGSGRSAWLLTERFGPLTFTIALLVEDARLHFVLRGWSLLGVRLAGWLAPRSLAFESQEDNLFHFHVEISLPLVGLLVRYRGQLMPD
jgi:hypothetical protein